MEPKTQDDVIKNVIVMRSSSILLSPVRAFDIVGHHQISWSLAFKQGSYTGGGGGGEVEGGIHPLTLPDSETPGLFRVKKQLWLLCSKLYLQLF